MALVGEMQYLTIGNNTYSLPHGAEPGNNIQNVGTSATSATGSSTAFAREDHVHALTAAAGTAVGLASTGYVTGLPISTFTNDKGYITQGQIPPGAAAYDGPMSKVGQTTAAGSSNAFARGDHVHSIVPSDFGLATTADLNNYATTAQLNAFVPISKISSGTTSTINNGGNTLDIKVKKGNIKHQIISDFQPDYTDFSIIAEDSSDYSTGIIGITPGFTRVAASNGTDNDFVCSELVLTPTDASLFVGTTGSFYSGLYGQDGTISLAVKDVNYNVVNELLLSSIGTTSMLPIVVGSTSSESMALVTNSQLSAATSASGVQNLIDGSGSSAVHQVGSTAAGDNSFAEGYLTYASTAAHSQGINTSATGSASHSEGFVTLAEGNSSHAEGQQTSAIDILSHAEGYKTYAASTASHAEGYQTTADSIYSHAEGNKTRSYGPYSHAQGCSSSATAQSSHAEGQETRASGMYSHAQGYLTTAKGSAGHAEGNYTLASGMYSHAAGERTVAQGYAQTVIGRYNIQQGSSATTASSDNAFIIGNGLNGNNKSNAMSITWAGDQTLAGALTLGSQATASNQAVRFDQLDTYATTAQILNNIIDGSGSSALHQISCYANGDYSFAEGYQTTAANKYSHSQGYQSKALSSFYNHAQGYRTTSSGNSSHTEGYQTLASSTGAHAQGEETQALAARAHAEGYKTLANKTSSHAEGSQTTADGYFTHTQGYRTYAASTAAHAEGSYTTASGQYSHAGGLYTIANEQAQTAIGKYNVIPTTAQAFIIGNGASTAARSNAMTVDWDGNVNLPSTASTYQINNTNILQLIYPIGAIYMSTNDTLPAALVSFGTWTQIKDVFLLAAGDAYSAGSTGGSATIEYTPAGSNSATALSVAQMPSHYHYIVRNANSQGATTASELSASNYISAYATAAKTDLTYSLRHHNSTPNVGRSSSQGSGNTHNHTWTGTKATLDNMPPYKVVYAWQRTA